MLYIIIIVFANVLQIVYNQWGEFGLYILEMTYASVSWNQEWFMQTISLKY